MSFDFAAEGIASRHESKTNFGFGAFDAITVAIKSEAFDFVPGEIALAPNAMLGEALSVGFEAGVKPTVPA